MDCGVCKKELNRNVFTINNVPEHTFKFSDKTVDLHIVKCDNCQAVQLVDVPLNEDFREVYRSIGSIPEHREKKKKELNDFIEEWNLWDKSFLEVGCGNGQYLDIFRELGIECDGYEHGEDNLIECQQKGYIVGSEEMFNPDEEEYKTKYDVIVSFFFLEHMPDPLEVCTSIYDKLKPGGMLYIEVPNYDVIDREGIWMEMTRDHRFYFGLLSIKYLLQKIGFDIIEIDNTTLTLKVLAYKYDIFKNIREKMEEDVSKFEDMVEEIGSYAVVGASHYTQLLLNQIDKKPDNIYDTVPAKIGNTLCGVIIQPQDEIVDCQCDTVIISCGVYNKLAKENVEKLVKDKRIIVWG